MVVWADRRNAARLKAEPAETAGRSVHVLTEFQPTKSCHERRRHARFTRCDEERTCLVTRPALTPPVAADRRQRARCPKWPAVPAGLALRARRQSRRRRTRISVTSTVERASARSRRVRLPPLPRGTPDPTGPATSVPTPAASIAAASVVSTLTASRRVRAAWPGDDHGELRPVGRYGVGRRSARPRRRPPARSGPTRRAGSSSEPRGHGRAPRRRSRSWPALSCRCRRPP